jgi:hypothetical protein
MVFLRLRLDDIAAYCRHMQAVLCLVAPEMISATCQTKVAQEKTF